MFYIYVHRYLLIIILILLNFEIDPITRYGSSLIWDRVPIVSSSVSVLLQGLLTSFCSFRHIFMWQVFTDSLPSRDLYSVGVVVIRNISIDKIILENHEYYEEKSSERTKGSWDRETVPDSVVREGLSQQGAFGQKSEWGDGDVTGRYFRKTFQVEVTGEIKAER